jgi:cytidylate kinase
MKPGVASMTFEQVAAAVRGRSAARGRSRIVGVDGMSGAGKTGFARRLAAELDAPCLCTDDFVPGWNGLAESVGLLVDWVLRPLAEGRPARWQRYDWMAGRAGDWAELPGADVVVVEGCCVGMPAAAAYLSYLVWVEAQPTERRLRVERRDNWYFYAPFADSWSRQERALQAESRTAERADVVIDNSTRRADGGWPDSFAVCPVSRRAEPGRQPETGLHTIPVSRPS